MAGLVFLFLLLIIAAAFIVCGLFLFRPRHICGVPEFEVSEVEFSSSDDVALKGWWVEGKQDLPVLLLCHGIGVNRFDLYPLAKELHELGHPLFMFDFRGHGQSGGARITYGQEEHLDVTAAIDYLKQNKLLQNRPLCIYALSMGGASVLMMGEQAASLSIEAIAIDSVFARFSKIAASKFQVLPIFIRTPFYKLLLCLCRWFFNFDVNRLNPVDGIRHFSSTRFLFIHSRQDALIPFAHGEELYSNCPGPKQFKKLSGLEHGDSFLIERKKFARELQQFFLGSEA